MKVPEKIQETQRSALVSIVISSSLKKGEAPVEIISSTPHPKRALCKDSAPPRTFFLQLGT
jgi:hypothetical protein